MAVRLDVERALTEGSDRPKEIQPTRPLRRARLSFGRRVARGRSTSLRPVDGSFALRYLYQHSVA